MQITNNNRLPAPLVRAVSRHPRTREPNTISVSELIQPIQLRALSVQHESELTEDASDRLWALLGDLLHYALEKNAKGLPNVISEEELSMEVLGWKLIGHYDLSESSDDDLSSLLLEEETLTDYKLTSVWAVKNGLKPEWISQLNVYAHLIRANGRRVGKGQIVAIGRDWSKRKAKWEHDYPKQQVKVMDVGLWTPEEAQEYIERRVQLHQRATEGVWPECTPEERWSKPTKYALMKKGRKRAVKLYEEEERALAAAGSDNFVEIRPGEETRCDSYCAVSRKCPQIAKINAQRFLSS